MWGVDSPRPELESGHTPAVRRLHAGHYCLGRPTPLRRVRVRLRVNTHLSLSVDQLLRPSPASTRMKAGPTCRGFRVRWGTSPAPYLSQALAPSLPQTGMSGSAAVAYLWRGVLRRSRSEHEQIRNRMDRANGTGGKLAGGLGFAGLVSFDGISIAQGRLIRQPPNPDRFGIGPGAAGARPYGARALRAASVRCAHNGSERPIRQPV